MTQHLSVNRDLYSLSAQNFLGGQLSGYSRKNPERRKSNEDCLFAVEWSANSGLVGIADGMGGHRGGDQASRLIAEHFAALKPTDDLLNAIEAAGARIMDLRLGAGSTLTLVEFREDHVRFYNVGDSPGYLLGGRGKVKFRTWDHSDKGLVRVALGDSDRELALVSGALVNSMGQADFRIEVSPRLSLAHGDVILLGTDGLTDNLSDDELMETATTGALNLRMENLSRRAEGRMTNPQFGRADDLSMWLYKHGTSPEAE